MHPVTRFQLKESNVEKNQRVALIYQRHPSVMKQRISSRRTILAPQRCIVNYETAIDAFFFAP